MRRSVILICIALFSMVFLPAISTAGPDRFIGDSAIYTGEAIHVRPNVLFIFDNNSTMGNTAVAADPYNPATVYAGSYNTYTVYKVTGMSNYVAHIANDTSALTNVSCAAAKTDLQTIGSYSGSGSSGLKNTGTCGNGGADLVYLGNLLNYNAQAAAGGTDAQVRIVKDAVLSVVNTARNIVNFGVMTFGENKSGGRVVEPVTNMSDINHGTDATVAAYNSFVSKLPGTGSTGVGSGPGGTYADGPSPAVALLNGNGRPLAEALYDAGAYYKGVYPIIYNQGSFASPILYSCQRSFVIVITNGDTDLDNSPKLGQTTALGLVGDYHVDGLEPGAYGTGTHYMDDVAKFIYHNPPSGSDTGITTYGVQIFSPEKPLVKLATQLGGSAEKKDQRYFVASDASAIANALTLIINSIVLEADTSFAAPVVPVSPENKTYSGSRLYMGFFKPDAEGTWLGNLKKLGLNSSLAVVDKNDAIATSSTDGSILSTSFSYWNSTTDADGGHVDQGGVGALLKNQTTRYIYTYTGSSTSLINASNAFTTDNAAITHTTLDVSDSTAKNKLVNFVRGLDAYDDDIDGDTSEKRSWILGDILHSRPMVVNYASYAFNPANEADCSVNKAMIYVGANDGMLHAFKDCDGSEAWAFIPQDLLPNLKYLRESGHPYFVDGTPTVYIYDADKDGTIESGDKVILIFGERRGGGKDASPTAGFYYALDVTNPAAPVYMWRLSNTVSPSGTTTDYSEMGESWSTPKLGKVKIGSTDKIVAFVGAGYDNLNEDSRYGATQTYPDTTGPATGAGTVTSSGSSSPSNPKGRGIYVIEIAALDSSGVPSFTNSGHKVWGYTNASSSTMAFSIPSEMSVQDTNYNGYIDRLYVGDTGGNLWRFNIGDTSTSNWTATKIFASNPGSGGDSDKGRKIFYRPAVTFEQGYQMIFMGTGDREHPLNRNEAGRDRMYAIKDTGQASAKTESDMTDVTSDALQGSDATAVANTLTNLGTSSGWYIKLDQYSGEKVLAEPFVLNRVAYYTTHTPNIPGDDDDPCSPGNLGTGRIYAVNYKTGEAAINYDTTNDGSTPSNTRALDSAGHTLLRSDRVMTLGVGIPSGVVGVLSAGGDTGVLVGIGMGIASPESKKGGGVIPIYWRQK